jgi:spore germination protein YaaH
VRFGPFYSKVFFYFSGMDGKDQTTWFENGHGFSVRMNLKVPFYAVGANDFANREKPIFSHNTIR